MKRFILTAAALASVFIFAACGGNDDDHAETTTPTVTTAAQGGDAQPEGSGSQPSGFALARAGFETNIIREVTNDFAIPSAPPGIFDFTFFPTQMGYDDDSEPVIEGLAAFISSDPGTGRQYPLVIWVSGGWSNAISDLAWSYPAWDNDQTGSAFRDAGMLMMYPSFRGANGNPGQHETLFGEIDDIVAAFHYAAARPYVDASRIYLAGHSTGATRVLLAAAYFDGFAGAFAFGPVGDIMQHNVTQFTFDTNDETERRLRSPIYWLDYINVPTYIIEGADGNRQELLNMQNATDNPLVSVHVIEGADHFSYLAPITRMIAPRVAAGNLGFTTEELTQATTVAPQFILPILLPYHNDMIGITMQIPFIWEVEWSGGLSFAFMSEFWDANFWEGSMMFLDAFYIGDEVLTAEEIAWEFMLDEVHTQHAARISGNNAYIWMATADFGHGEEFNKAVAVQVNGQLIMMEFFTLPEFEYEASRLFEMIYLSAEFN